MNYHLFKVNGNKKSKHNKLHKKELKKKKRTTQGKTNNKNKSLLNEPEQGNTCKKNACDASFTSRN